MRTNGTRITSGNTGNCRARPVQRRPTLTNSRGTSAITAVVVKSVVSTMAHLSGNANAGVDVRVEQIDNQVDQHDHDAGLHDDPLHEREIALEDPLIKQPADAGPGKDHF